MRRVRPPKPRMKSSRGCFLLVAGLSLHASPTVFAQDNGRLGEPIMSSIDPAKLSYDYLVDGSLSQDDPGNHRFKTLAAAYAAAPAGTAAQPTVIGLLPGVYLLAGTSSSAGIDVRKNYLTLLGLTNNRRSVVLAGNRGNKEGGGDVATGTSYNGYVVTVNATGFTARNLTILNYCNVDYEYPGDPSKNLHKRAPVITQAVALGTAGDKHAYINVAILGRLDTGYFQTVRAYYKDVFIEGTNHFIGGGTASYWEDCTVDFPEGNGVMLASGIAFVNSRFTATRGFQWYDGSFGPNPSILINCTVPVAATAAPVAWVRGEAPPRPNYYSLTYRVKDPGGKPAVIWDASGGPHTTNYSRELTAAEAAAFNPWNLLRATPAGTADDWDPANAREKYEALGQGSLVYRMTLNNATPSVRVNTAGTRLTATVAPARASDSTITWSTKSDLVALSAATGKSIVVTAKPAVEKPDDVPVTATAANGFCATAWVHVEPAYIDPPAIASAPVLGAPREGAVTVNYALKLGGHEDQSLVSWAVCDDATGRNARLVAVSRGGRPTRSYSLSSADVGKILRVTLEPKHDRSEPGPAVVAYAARPVQASDLPSPDVSPDFRSFVTDPNPGYVGGRWTFLGTWTVENGPKFAQGWGARAGTRGASMLYQQDGEFGDMQVDVVLTHEKGDGSGFGSPGSSIDGELIQKSDLFVKYDPRTRSGYSLRYWRSKDATNQCVFQLFRHTAGAGTPLSDRQVVSGVLLPSTHVTLRVVGTKFTAELRNDVNQETVSLAATVEPNKFGGAGAFWSGTVYRGNSVAYSQFKIAYPGQAGK